MNQINTNKKSIKLLNTFKVPPTDSNVASEESNIEIDYLMCYRKNC